MAEEEQNKYREILEKERDKVKKMIDINEFDFLQDSNKEKHQTVPFPYGGDKRNFLQWK